jgi:hypothetical protein
MDDASPMNRDTAERGVKQKTKGYQGIMAVYADIRKGGPENRSC